MWGAALVLPILLSLSLSGCDGTPTTEDAQPPVPSAVTITAVPNPSEGGNVAGGGTYPRGQSVTVIATPGGGFQFGGWSEGSDTVSLSPSYSFTAERDRSLAASFVPKRHNLEVGGSGPGDGLVISDPSGIECRMSNAGVDGECIGTFDEGTQLILRAEPDEGSRFSGWTGACGGIDNCLLQVTGDLNVTAAFGAELPAASAQVGYQSPEDFRDGMLAIELPTSPSGRTFLVGVPALGSEAWWTRSQFIHEQTFDFRVEVQTSQGLEATPLRTLPERVPPPLNVWEVPAVGEPQSLEADKDFYLWSHHEQDYVVAHGALAFEGADFAFYEDLTNQDNFSLSEYETLNGVLENHFPRVKELMGEPTDLDGNGRILVFISRSMMDHRTAGEAYVDGCHMRENPGGCVHRGEFVYIASMDHIGGMGPRASLVSNYYPRNILHESIHLLQQGHAYRRSGTWAGFHTPAYYGEGQAELMSFESDFRASTIWGQVRERFLRTDQIGSTPFNLPYSMGALWHWYLHQNFGEGLSQAIIDAVYDPASRTRSLTEVALGIPEPLLLAQMYASMIFDGSEFGEAHALHFPQDDVTARLSGEGPPVIRVAPGGEAAAGRRFTGGVIFEIEHDGPVRVEFNVSPEPAYVLVAQPPLE